MSLFALQGTLYKTSNLLLKGSRQSDNFKGNQQGGRACLMQWERLMSEFPNPDKSVDSIYGVHDSFVINVYSAWIAEFEYNSLELLFLQDGLNRRKRYLKVYIFEEGFLLKKRASWWSPLIPLNVFFTLHATIRLGPEIYQMPTQVSSQINFILSSANDSRWLYLEWWELKQLWENEKVVMKM